MTGSPDATIGHRVWAVPGGFMPAESTGAEPAMTSRDVLSVLNTGERAANVDVTIFYADRDPVGPYRFTVGARRVRQVRVNDLIDPEAIPLATPYAAVIAADVPVVVQYLRQDTSQQANALSSVMAFPATGPAPG